MKQSKPKILVIDDDEAILNLYHDTLSSRYQVVTAKDWLDGADLLIGSPFDLLILDLRMVLFDPVEFISKVRAHGHTLPILVSSAYPNLRERVAGLEVNAILGKPFRLSELEETVSQLLEASNGSKKK